MEAQPQLPPPLPGQQSADQYLLYRKLEEGGQANIYMGSRKTQIYPIKVYLPGANRFVDYQRQIEFLSQLHFRHLINIVEHRPSALIRLINVPQYRGPIIVLQVADGLQLFDYISRLGRFTPNIARYYAKQLIATVKYLASQNVTHRDIKPQNIFLDSHFNIKLFNFNLAGDARGDYRDGMLRSRVGTQGYQAPQIYEGSYTGIQADLFATGVVLFIMYTGTPPFNSAEPHDRIYRLIRQQNFAIFWTLHSRRKPEGFFPDSFKKLINSFFNIDPARRPTFQSLENDQWWNQDLLPGGIPPNLLNQAQGYMREKYNALHQ